MFRPLSDESTLVYFDRECQFQSNFTLITVKYPRDSGCQRIPWISIRTSNILTTTTPRSHKLVSPPRLHQSDSDNDTSACASILHALYYDYSACASILRASLFRRLRCFVSGICFGSTCDILMLSSLVWFLTCQLSETYSWQHALSEIWHVRCQRHIYRSYMCEIEFALYRVPIYDIHMRSSSVPGPSISTEDVWIGMHSSYDGWSGSCCRRLEVTKWRRFSWKWANVNHVQGLMMVENRHGSHIRGSFPKISKRLPSIDKVRFCSSPIARSLHQAFANVPKCSEILRNILKHPHMQIRQVFSPRFHTHIPQNIQCILQPKKLPNKRKTVQNPYNSYCVARWLKEHTRACRQYFGVALGELTRSRILRAAACDHTHMSQITCTCSYVPNIHTAVLYLTCVGSWKWVSRRFMYSPAVSRPHGIPLRAHIILSVMHGGIHYAYDCGSVIKLLGSRIELRTSVISWFTVIRSLFGQWDNHWYTL